MESHRSDKIRRLIVTAAAACFMSAIIAALWFQDWQYSRPTHVPPGLHQPALDAKIALPAGIITSGRRRAPLPIVLNFYNLACPCTRFNFGHVRDLMARYSDRIRFVGVIEDTQPEQHTADYDSLRVAQQYVPDPGGAIARACGVYATPQAVVLTPDGRLYYRGNYNASRYCNDPTSEFLRLALESLVADRPCPDFGRRASRSYGCALPAYTASR